MKIYVCVKHVPDSAATITIREKNQIDEGITFLLNPYDENAVAEATALRERIENSEVIAVTLGKEGALNTLQSALAMGADRGLLIKTDDQPDAEVAGSQAPLRGGVGAPPDSLRSRVGSTAS